MLGLELAFPPANWDTRSSTASEKNPIEESAVPGKTVVVKLNQQQLELLDKTVARGAAPDRIALIRRALREYAAKHPQPKAGSKA